MFAALNVEPFLEGSKVESNKENSLGQISATFVCYNLPVIFDVNPHSRLSALARLNGSAVVPHGWTAAGYHHNSPVHQSMGDTN